MRSCRKFWAILFLSSPCRFPSFAATCTTQAAMEPGDRNMLSAVALRLSAAVQQQDFNALQAALLPAESSQWDSIRGAAEQAVPLLANGQMQLTQSLPSSTPPHRARLKIQCSSAPMPKRLTAVTVSMPGLPLASMPWLWLKPRERPLTADWESFSPGAEIRTDGSLQVSRLTRESSMAMMASGTGRAPALCAKSTRGLPGTPTTPHTTSCCRWIISPRPTSSKLRQEQSQISPPAQISSSFPARRRPHLEDRRRAARLLASRAGPWPGLRVNRRDRPRRPAYRGHHRDELFSQSPTGHSRQLPRLFRAYSVKDGKRSPIMELPMAKIP